MAQLPSGTATFVLTDLEGSTRLWESDAAGMRQAMGRHDAIIAAVVASQRGVVIRSRGEGDSRFAVFPNASDAVAAAVAIQRDLAGYRRGASVDGAASTTRRREARVGEAIDPAC